MFLIEMCLYLLAASLVLILLYAITFLTGRRWADRLFYGAFICIVLSFAFLMGGILVYGVSYAS